MLKEPLQKMMLQAPTRHNLLVRKHRTNWHEWILKSWYWPLLNSIRYGPSNASSNQTQSPCKKAWYKLARMDTKVMVLAASEQHPIWTIKSLQRKGPRKIEKTSQLQAGREQ
ncbi:unnamed protein product [Toxocara canis]|uniref:Ovule protein n=1 Tax=Toxocara canis TaxID=6265 RepID=A0A183U4U3_TOXCA|nr:unnamed protein product [Toxocara canis]